MKLITKLITLFAALFLTLSLTGCGTYNKIQDKEIKVDQMKAEMLSVGQKRLDSLDNLVATVKGAAGHEKDTLTEVVALRSKVGSINVTPTEGKKIDATEKAKMQEYMNGQAELGSAISRLLVVSENYPNLKANENFLQLQRDLKRLDREMDEARKGYIQAIASYNSTISRVPGVIYASIFGYEKKPQYEVTSEANVKSAPKVKF